MNPVRPLLPLTLAYALSCAPALADDSDRADREIGYLLDFVGDSGCTFSRNGKEHVAADAADHLRLKYSRGRRYAGSAEQFIDRLASESSWTGEPYTVTCDGVTESSGEWLHRALERYRRHAGGD
jgi:hypothetical protein